VGNPSEKTPTGPRTGSQFGPQAGPQAPGGCGCGAGGVRIVTIKGAQIGLNRLDAIIRSVKASGLKDEAAVRRELMRLVRAVNYVPPGLDAAYEEAVWQEYSRSG